MRERPPPAGFFEDERPLAYAGHCWFGAHRWVGRPVHACTVLRERGETVMPVCPVFALWLKKHAEAHDVVHPSYRSALGIPVA